MADPDMFESVFLAHDPGKQNIKFDKDDNMLSCQNKNICIVGKLYKKLP